MRDVGCGMWVIVVCRWVQQTKDASIELHVFTLLYPILIQVVGIARAPRKSTR